MGRFKRLSDKLAAVVVLGIFIGALLTPTLIYRVSSDTVKFKVKRLERVNTLEESKYLIFTEGGEVFENVDTLTFFKFNSSDVQGQLTEGETFTATVAGWRVPWLSIYRNVVSVEQQ